MPRFPKYSEVPAPARDLFYSPGKVAGNLKQGTRLIFPMGCIGFVKSPYFLKAAWSLLNPCMFLMTFHSEPWYYNQYFQLCLVIRRTNLTQLIQINILPWKYKNCGWKSSGVIGQGEKDKSVFYQVFVSQRYLKRKSLPKTGRANIRQSAMFPKVKKKKKILFNLFSLQCSVWMQFY